jgi:hypothetical protein
MNVNIDRHGNAQGATIGCPVYDFDTIQTAKTPQKKAQCSRPVSIPMPWRDRDHDVQEETGKPSESLLSLYNDYRRSRHQHRSERTQVAKDIRLVLIILKAAIFVIGLTFLIIVTYL